MATPELRHMLRDDDLNHEEQKQVLELAIKFHNDRFYHQPFAGPQGIAVIFDKPSTRTRSSFSIGVAELGGYPLVIDKSGSQLGRGEPVADTARVLDRMAYGVVWRTFGQDRVEEMAKYSTHPVVNALTDEFHPCQILADFQTIAEHRGGVDNLKNQTIAYLGDAANNMSNSYLLGGAVAGMNVRVAGPNGLSAGSADRCRCRSHRIRNRRFRVGDHRSEGSGRRRRLRVHRYMGFPWAKNRNTPSVPSRSGIIR